MATDGGDVEFKFRGDSSDLDAALVSISRNLDSVVDAGSGAANTLNKGLTSATDKARKALKDATNQAKATSTKFSDLEDQSGKADSAIQGVAAALSLVSPEAAEAARAVGDVSGALEGAVRLGGVSLKFLGPLALAAAAVGGAYLVYKRGVDEANEAQVRARAVQDVLKTSTEKLRDRRLDLAVATGELTDEEAALTRLRRQAFAEQLPAIQEITARLTEQQLKVQRLVDADEDLVGVNAALAAQGRDNAAIMLAGAGAAAALEGAQEELAEIEQERIDAIATLNANIADSIELETKIDTANRRHAASVEALVEAEERRAGALKAIRTAGESAILANAGAAEEVERLQAATEGLTSPNLRELERLAILLQEIETASAASTAAGMALADSRIAVTNALQKEAQAIEDADAAAKAKELQENLVSTAEASTQLAGNISAAFTQTAQKLASEGKASALAAFKAAKAAAFSEAVIAGALGVVKALGAGVPPLNFIAAAGVGVAAGAQIAAIANAEPPQFAFGGLAANRMDSTSARVGTDHRTAAVDPREGIVTVGGMERLGVDGLNAINSGGSVGSAPIAVPLLGSSRAFLEDELNVRSALRRATRRNARAGQRR